ncbi:NUDIX hydrolase [Salsipaludibacter albus]|uniref:NUDIX hydrolase n=1 Tax=Salsipaludibacter albus TaxID=2849650 RepID=UPI001EE4CD4B|nr:NUDIX domain-containing protein [Salsipaludibacter albus]
MTGPTDGPASTRTATPAATVVVVRDHVDGLQVLLQERALASDFVGGAWVFPGGKVDPRDAEVASERLGPVDLSAVHARLGAATPGETRALLVAAVRETFEEAGLLLGTTHGRPVTSDDLAADDVRATRQALADRASDHDWRPFLDERDVVLDVGALRPLAWWITPHGLHRRFSTRFFVTGLPVEQDPAGHDDVEMTGTVWETPAAALDAARRGDRMVIFPTRRVLESLEELPDVAAVLDHADHDRFDLRPILPLDRSRGCELLVQHPDGGPPVDV